MPGQRSFSLDHPVADKLNMASQNSWWDVWWWSVEQIVRRKTVKQCQNQRQLQEWWGGGAKGQQQRWGQRREKGCECIDPSHNLHFWTRTSLQTLSCPHFLFIILEVEEVTPQSSIYHFLSSYIKHLHKIQDSAPHNSRWKRQRRPNSSMRWKLTSVSTKKTAYPGGRRETE